MDRDGMWHHPRRSFEGNSCVEVAPGWLNVGIRDSKLGDQSPVLLFPPDAFRAFVDSVKAGEFGER